MSSSSPTPLFAEFFSMTLSYALTRSGFVTIVEQSWESCQWNWRLEHEDQLPTILIEILLSYDIKGGDDVLWRNSVLFQNAKQIFECVRLEREQVFPREYLQQYHTRHQYMCQIILSSRFSNL